MRPPAFGCARSPRPQSVSGLTARRWAVPPPGAGAGACRRTRRAMRATSCCFPARTFASSVCAVGLCWRRRRWRVPPHPARNVPCAQRVRPAPHTHSFPGSVRPDGLRRRRRRIMPLHPARDARDTLLLPQFPHFLAQCAPMGCAIAAAGAAAIGAGRHTRRATRNTSRRTQCAPMGCCTAGAGAVACRRTRLAMRATSRASSAARSAAVSS